MKAVIINCFDTYEGRVNLVHEFFKGQGYDVTVVQSDFSHFNKGPREELKEDCIFVNSIPYYKNLSIERLSSHYKYARDAFKIVETLKPDLIYTFVPPNSLAKFAAKYKQNHHKVKLVFDIMDLWPETMPIKKFKKLPLFKLWGNLRDNSLKYADLTITECNLYQRILKNTLIGSKTETVYLAKKENNIVHSPLLSKNEIHLAYLGSINNIIDISEIQGIIYELKTIRPVTLHIIGDGESKQELINTIHSCGATVEDHGNIYDAHEKQGIFDRCHFGLNIMKDTVCVGLTMKSIDYFQHGLPIINNIPADTEEIVVKYGVGVNYSSAYGKTLNFADYFIEDNLLRMRKNSIKLYNELFSYNSYNIKMTSIINEL